jgi:hypothetical protein
MRFHLHRVRRFFSERSEVLIILCFVLGVLFGFGSNWYMAGLYPEGFRMLPNEKQIMLLRDIGLKASPLRVRDVLLSAYPDQPPEAHEMAHLIGEAAYMKLGPSGFSLCDSAFTFACFHGVILSAIRTHGNDDATIKTVATGCDAAGKNETAKISCAHGIGHGIMWVRDYNLVVSFELCDQLFADERLRFFCWDGVSMENVVRRGEAAREMSKIPWKQDNIYYPCDSVPAVYQAACVREHLFLVRLLALNSSTEESIAYCLYFGNSDVRSQCFGALGRALNQDDPTKTDHIIGECNKAPSDYISTCLGSAAMQYAFAGQKNTGQQVCAAISLSEARFSCLQGIEKAIDSLYVIQYP